MSSPRGLRGRSPPRTGSEKDLLIEKLGHDNEVLMREVADLDRQLREEKETGRQAEASLRQELATAESSASMCQRVVEALEEQLRQTGREREEQARSHAEDKRMLGTVCRLLYIYNIPPPPPHTHTLAAARARARASVPHVVSARPPTLAARAAAAGVPRA